MEARTVGTTLSADADPASVGPIGVSGMLAEQLAKELSAGAASGAIVVGGTDIVDRAEVLVRIVAGDPTPEDEQLVRAADGRGVPVVVVQLWPQADWTMPFVLTPFVVECRAGEGFPVGEIADRIVEATESSAVLAVARSGHRGGDARPLGEERRPPLCAHRPRRSASRRLAAAPDARAGSHARRSCGRCPPYRRQRTSCPSAPEAAAAVLAAGFAFRGLARSVRTVVPAPIAHAAVAAAGTWLIAKAYEVAETRLPSS